MTKLLDTHQIPIYIAAIACGLAVGSFAPQTAPYLGPVINPLLALLLFITFLAIPFDRIFHAFHDLRFLACLLVGNFVIMPVVAFTLGQVIDDRLGLRVGMMLVLLCPCIDYVIVFTGLAQGASTRLLAVSPAIMLAQILLLPVFLYFFFGRSVLSSVSFAPFIEAFLTLIIAPLILSAALRTLGKRYRTLQRTTQSLLGSMVPVMSLTLTVVIASQISAVGPHAKSLLPLAPLYAVFALVGIGVGFICAKISRLDVAATRAAIFSCTTRNSLVVLPIALALPAHWSLAPLAVVTQTLVELIFMVAMVHMIPKLTPGNP
jgi:ACR3 family arsenite efflux pump ArsB